MPSASLYTEDDRDRFSPLSAESREAEPYRTDWRRDAARVLHSPCFRRLQGKTQLFPGFESDFFRNRLTHSLEVGQIAKSIAIRLNANEKFLEPPDLKIEPDLTELAGWCHDLGHSPFGHNGELALNDLMQGSGGFEGNAQTLRLLCRLEKRTKDTTVRHGIDGGKDERLGLNLTYRSLAACLKYDEVIPASAPKLVKGYYEEEAERVRTIKEKVTGTTGFGDSFKVIECYIMDIADDIAYSTYDLEDAFKARFLSPFDMIAAREEVLDAVTDVVRRRSGLEVDSNVVREVIYSVFGQLFPEHIPGISDSTLGSKVDMRAAAYAAGALGYDSGRALMEDGYLRTAFTSQLIGEFISSVELIPNEDIPALSEVRLNDTARLKVEVLKNFTYQSLILAPDLQVVRNRSQEIVKQLFERLSSGDGNFTAGGRPRSPPGH